jgi:hypothetical protein
MVYASNVKPAARKLVHASSLLLLLVAFKYVPGSTGFQ